MSKAYSSNLTEWQWELIEPLIPPAKPGGRNARGRNMVGAKCNLLCVDTRLHMAEPTRRLPRMANMLTVALLVTHS
jgi:transposase